MPEHHEFRVEEHSRREHLTSIGVSLFFIATIAAALLSVPRLRTLPILIACGAAVLVLLLVLLREIRTMIEAVSDPIVIDEQGVRYASPGAIAWTDVAGIEPVLSKQRVDLLDAQGRVRVSLRYDLEDAADLLQFVADMLADRWPKKTLPYDFSYQVSWRMTGAAVAPIAVLGGAASLLRSRPTIETACFGAVALLVMGYIAVWNSSVRRLTVKSDGISVTTGITSKALRFPDVTAIAIALVRQGKGRRRLDVRVTSRDKSETYVLPRSCDPFEIYATLKAAWERGRTASAHLAEIPVSAA
jgi:hypothetical protein